MSQRERVGEINLIMQKENPEAESESEWHGIFRVGDEIGRAHV